MVFISGVIDKETFLADDEIHPIALGAAQHSWRRQVHIHFAYYKYLNANALPRMSKYGGMEASMPGQSDVLDGHKERGSVMLDEAPLSDMDLMKQFILTHSRCQVDVPMDRLPRRQSLSVIGNWHSLNCKRLGY